MTFPMYCVRDIKVGFGTPQVKANEAVARRDFAQQFDSPGSTLAFAPQDFALFLVGEFDPDHATIVPCLPTLVVEGLDIIGGK